MSGERDQPSASRRLSLGNGGVTTTRDSGEPPKDRFRTKRKTSRPDLFDRGAPTRLEMHGMYAFIIAGEDGRFVAARDPVGIKPLYWARRDDHVRFASELGAYDEDWQLDAEAFPPGHYWTPEDGLVRFATPVPHDKDDLEHFEGPSEPGAEIPDSILTRVRDQLIETVEGQMMGDVPVGVFLSGGLDSTSSPHRRPLVREARREDHDLRVGSKTAGTWGAVAFWSCEYLGTALRASTRRDALRFCPRSSGSRELDLACP